MSIPLPELRWPIMAYISFRSTSPAMAAPSDGQEDKSPKGHGFKIVVIRARRGLGLAEGEEVLNERTRVGHVGVDAFGEAPRNMDEELLLQTEDYARLAGGHIVRAILEFDLSETVLC